MRSAIEIRDSTCNLLGLVDARMVPPYIRGLCFDVPLMDGDCGVILFSQISPMSKTEYFALHFIWDLYRSGKCEYPALMATDGSIEHLHLWHDFRKTQISHNPLDKPQAWAIMTALLVNASI